MVLKNFVIKGKIFRFWPYNVCIGIIPYGSIHLSIAIKLYLEQIFINNNNKKHRFDLLSYLYNAFMKIECKNIQFKYLPNQS